MENLFTDSDFVHETFGPGVAGIVVQQPGPSSTTFVQTINGLAGSVTFGGGTTGLTFSAAGSVVSLGGTLAVANGGTGAATAGGARVSLSAAQSGANADITSLTALSLLRLLATSPAQITADQNDYNPGTGSNFRLSTDAARTVTGFAGGADGRLMLIANVGSFNLVLANQNAGSVAANRIVTGTGADVTVAADDTAILIYDSVSSRWRLFA